MRTPDQLPLTAARARQMLAYNTKTGVLKWRIGGRGHRKGKRAGAVCGDYRKIMLDTVNYCEHRVIWLMQKGKWPACLVDHRNGNGLDNRWTNLREASHAENGQNKRASRASKSGIRGVSWTNNKWQADIGLNGKIIHLGRFDCVEAATAARCEAEKHYFGDFARQAERYPANAAE